MSYEVQVSDLARKGIEAQLDWYSQETSEEHGDAWLEKLEMALTKLEKHPEQHDFAPENGRWRPELELRQLNFQPWKKKSVWRVLFVIEEASKVVSVIQIRHSRRPLLFEEK